MPRKRKKTEKPPLQFLERPVSVAKVRQHVPEVRAALNPKEFFTESETESSSALKSWVKPQFDSSAAAAAAAAAPTRRGRRKLAAAAAASLVDGNSQLCRKTSICKFPPLPFHTAQHRLAHPPRARTAAANLQQASRPIRAKNSKATARSHSSSESAGRCSDGAPTATHSQRNRRPAQVKDGDPPPDADPLEEVRDDGGAAPTPSAHPLLLHLPRTPPCHQRPDVLVADTPERDYGVKVTWRRRKELMRLLRARGHLSKSDSLIHN